MAFVYNLYDNSAELLKATAKQVEAALEAVGQQAEGDIKDEITDVGAVDTGRLRSSIAHRVVTDESAVHVGTNVEYAVYVHEGTGKYAVGGNGTPKERWVYRDEAGHFHMAYPQKPRRFIKDAVDKHLADYRKIFEEYLKK